MILVDKNIEQFVKNAAGKQCDEECAKPAIFYGHLDSVTNIGYDLQAGKFFKDKQELTNYSLHPGESIFVGSEEIVALDDCTSGRVVLKNSRIRMGLTMDSPTYQPGHKTRIYFRLSNVSKNVIELKAGEKYTTIIFEQLNEAPQKPYAGTFSDEYDFKDLADYESAYTKQIHSLDEKFKDLDALEKTIYGNVISVLAVFVAAFTLLNMNITIASASKSVIDFLIYNLSVVGCISALVLLLNGILNKKKANPLLWLIPIVCLGTLICIAFFIL